MTNTFTSLFQSCYNQRAFVTPGNVWSSPPSADQWDREARRKWVGRGVLHIFKKLISPPKAPRGLLIPSTAWVGQVRGCSRSGEEQGPQPWATRWALKCKQGSFISQGKSTFLESDTMKNRAKRTLIIQMTLSTGENHFFSL